MTTGDDGRPHGTGDDANDPFDPTSGYRGDDPASTGGGWSGPTTPQQDSAGQGYGQRYGDQGYSQPQYGGQQDHGQRYGDPTYGAAYPQGGYGEAMPAAPYATPGRVSATDAVKAGWRMFTGNPLPWVLMTLISGLVSGITSQFSQSTSDDPNSFALSLGGILLSLLSALVGVLFQAFIIRGALLEVDGHKPSFGDFFKLHNFGWFLVAMILVSIASFIGLLALLVGAIVVYFFLYWTGYFAIDRNMQAIDAIKSSFNAIKSDAGNLFALALLNVLIMIAGFLALLVGVLVAVPVATLASVYAYRVITGPSDFSQRATAAPGAAPQQGY